MTETATVRIGVAGALGRMGRAVTALVRTRDSAVVGPLFDRPDFVGQTIDGLGLVGLDEALAGSDAIIDFTTPSASVTLAQAAAAWGAPALVIGSTGASEEQEAAIAEAARTVAIVRSGNFSLGLNLLLGLVRQAAKALDPADFDIEILETHHKRKVDAPSGTALMLGQAAADGRGVSLSNVSQRGRDGLTGARTEGVIGFASLRGGGVIGEHSVTFAGEEEIITLSHSARDRGLFARGGVQAALWVRSQPPGLYDMLDVLGLGGG